MLIRKLHKINAVCNSNSQCFGIGHECVQSQTPEEGQTRGNYEDKQAGEYFKNEKNEVKRPCVTLSVTNRCFLPDLAELGYLRLHRT